MADQERYPSYTAGSALIDRLVANGVSYIFANSGTDFPPIIEAIARRQAEGVCGLTAYAIPHESAAVAMAHGYYLVTGRPQAVMAHTNVGLANTAMGVINAAVEQIPMLLCSGRTPLTEHGHIGSRSTPINWGQEMRNQTALVSEAVKWSAELAYPEQMGDLIDRAFAIAESTPPGPVYISLPREPLCGSAPTVTTAPSRFSPALTRAHPNALAEAAALIVGARRPLLIAHRCDGTQQTLDAIQAFVEAFAVPLVEFWPSRISLDSHHPMHAGFDPKGDLAEADLVLVLDAMTPWIPQQHQLAPGARVIQLGGDPLQQRLMQRGFPVDVALPGDVGLALSDLNALIHQHPSFNPSSIQSRFTSLEARHAARRQIAATAAQHNVDSPMSAEWVSWCLSEAIGEDGILFSELGVRVHAMSRTKPGTYFNHAISGGLGWALPAALGAQLSDRDRLIVACVGDGSYMFANPVVCHQIAEALELPVLIVVMNNGVWNAVRNSTLQMFPTSFAARANVMPLTSLQPAPNYCKVAEASRAWSAVVEHAQDLPKILAQAIAVVRNERRHALIDIRVRAD